MAAAARVARVDRPDGLRERKKRATRLRISDIATALFTERGFDNVTVDEVAVAADVAKMTVFNYFARKEDLLFDRSDEPQQLLRDKLAHRGAQPPLAALRGLVHELVAERHQLVRMTPAVASFWKVVAESPALRAHTRRLAAELERDLGRLLAETVGAPAGEPTAQLVAALLVGTWRVAFREALRRQRSSVGRAAVTRAAFLALVDRGFAAATVAARGTAYTGAPR
ncbi:MAG TPA: TetR/AcrR family transcriptional regulator [Polyangia bacterium]|nr:TetR/AcrR family transcriptional regulator [Polyangia bacterium]